METAMHEAKSFCRTCIAQCGVILTIDEEGRLANIRADREHPVSAGYACFKGLQAPDSHNAGTRLLHSLKRAEGGGFDPVSSEQAFDDIAARLLTIRDRHGPEAIGLFRGTAGFHNSTAFGIHGEFLKALGTPSLFTTLSIDQSAKAIAACRMGYWHAGRDHIDDSDVAILFGSNPLISHSAGGFLVSDPVKRVKRAVERGLKLIVVDPRLTETARFASIHLQPYPGEDVAIAAGLLRLILNEGWHDQAFCTQFVRGLDRLREAVDPFTPDMVARRAGVPATLLHEAAELYAARSQRGGVITGTGPNMAPRSNLAEHLIQCIEIICGRFKRAGDVMPNADPLSPQQDWFAEVVPPFAPWDASPPSRIRGVGNLFGEKLTGTLAEEIMTPGPGQIRALIVDGSNIANSVPDRERMIAALRHLELLVVIDPHLTPTAQLADYVIAPTLQYERADLPITLGMALHADAWVQYTAAHVTPPAGSDVVDDWYVFWSLARRMDLDLQYAGEPIDMRVPPTTEELLALGMRATALTLDVLQAQPDQLVINPAGKSRVKPARPDATARFVLDSEGVLDELADVAAEPIIDRAKDVFPFRLIARRMRDVNGSIGMHTPAIRKRNPYNPVHINPDDMSCLGLNDGAEIYLISPNGRIAAMVARDATLRPGVVSMSHNWGSLSADDADYSSQGGSTNMLIRADADYEVLNAMPRMSAIPVRIELRADTDQPLV